MRWFFGAFATVTAVLFLSFIAWIVTRVMRAEGANLIVGQIMIVDLCAIGVILAYSAFVGAWHLWEKLTGRMEAERAEEDQGPAAVPSAEPPLSAGSPGGGPPTTGA